MQPTMTNDLNTDQAADVPITRDNLIEQAFCGIMDLPEDVRNRIHKKYLRRYGWYVE